MSKNSIHARIQCFNEWLEDNRKKQKFGFKKKRINDPSKMSGAEVEMGTYNKVKRGSKRK